MWVLEINGCETAVVAKQWTKPRMLITEFDPADSVNNASIARSGAGGNVAHFRYLNEACPDEVYNECRPKE